MSKLGADLLDTFEVKKEALSERINKIDTSASFDVQKDTIRDVIEEIACTDDDVEKELYVNLLSDKTGVDKRAIRRQIKTYTCHASVEATDNLTIAHPSYEVHAQFISLGFKETVLEQNKPQQRNIYLVGTGDTFKLYDSGIVDMGEKRIVFDERERVLVTLNDRWRKESLHTFINNPQPLEGVYEELKIVIKQYVDFQKEPMYGLMAAWIIGTYFHRCFHAFPFLFLYGKKQSGKSRTLDLLERLSFNAMKIKGVSVPSMTDSIDGIRGTFIMDQAEALSQKQNVELLGILADSYTPGGGKRRVVNITNKRRSLLEFETYSPKAFASIQEIDADLKDRCIEIVMIRADREYDYPEPFLPIWADLRDRLYRLLLTKWHDTRLIYQTAGLGMKNRIKELWKPIDTILLLENVPEPEKNSIRAAFLESMVETQSGLTELEEKLIQTLLPMLKDSEEGVFSVQDIQTEMNIPEGERFKKDQQSRWIGKTINKLCLASEQLAREGNKRRYRFTKQQIQNIFNRYQMNGFNGVMAQFNTEAILQTANEKAVNGANGEAMTQPTRAPIHANTTKVNGEAQTLDGSRLRQYANTANHLIEDDFVHEEDEVSEMKSMTCSDSNGAVADNCGDEPPPRGNCRKAKWKLYPTTRELGHYCTVNSAWCHVMGQKN